MSVKRKLGMGVATAALGLSLVGGGTWAAFTDTETLSNSFAAGNLNFEVQTIGGATVANGGSVLNLTNMKPGDSKEYRFRLDNIGSLAIKEIFISGVKVSSGWDNGATPTGELDADFVNTEDEFLSQFTIEIRDGNPTSGNAIISEMNLLTFLTNGVSRDAIANATVPGKGLPVDGDLDEVRVTLKFANIGNQNKFMNDSAQFKFNLQATQWEGVQINHEGNDKTSLKQRTTTNGVVERIEYNENQNYELNETPNDEGGN